MQLAVAMKCRPPEEAELLWLEALEKGRHHMDPMSFAALWKDYIRWKHSLSARFTVADARQDFLRALEAIATSQWCADVYSSHPERRNSAHDRLEARDAAIVELLRDAVKFEISTGHRERGLAVAQALLDFHLSAPTCLLSRRHGSGGSTSPR